jgi:uncharacterized coiled-coil protein SlyX
MDTAPNKTGAERVHERIDQLDRRVTTLEATIASSERNTDRRLTNLESIQKDITRIEAHLATLTARMDGHGQANKAWQGWSQALLMLVISALVAGGFQLLRGPP